MIGFTHLLVVLSSIFVVSAQHPDVKIVHLDFSKRQSIGDYQFPDDTPACAARCLDAKYNEQDALAPGTVKGNLAQACNSSAFQAAYTQCCKDHCDNADDIATALSAGGTLCRQAHSDAASSASIAATSTIGSVTNTSVASSVVSLAAISSTSQAGVTTTASSVKPASSAASTTTSHASSSASGKGVVSETAIVSGLAVVLVGLFL